MKTNSFKCCSVQYAPVSRVYITELNFNHSYYVKTKLDMISTLSFYTFR